MREEQTLPDTSRAVENAVTVLQAFSAASRRSGDGPIEWVFTEDNLLDGLKCVLAGFNAGIAEGGKDAERYALVRRGQHWSVINGIGDELRGESLDAAIDALLPTPPAAMPNKDQK